MPSPESVQIRSNLLAFKAAQGQGAPVPLSEQRASFDVRTRGAVSAWRLLYPWFTQIAS